MDKRLKETWKILYIDSIKAHSQFLTKRSVTTRSLGIRLRVQVKDFFFKIYAVRLWCGGLRPPPHVAIIFTWIKREKKIKTIKPSLSLLSERENQNWNFWTNCFQYTKYTLRDKCSQKKYSCPKTRKSTHGDYGKNT
jgi:hypothetical protein